MSSVSASSTVSGKDFAVVSGRIRLVMPAIKPTDPNIISGKALPKSVSRFFPYKFQISQYNAILVCIRATAISIVLT